MDCREILRSQFDACRHQLSALAIAGTGAVLLIIVAADKVRIAQLTGILKLKLDQAALGAPVAQRLPLLMRELSSFFVSQNGWIVFLIIYLHVPANRASELIIKMIL